MKRALVIGGGFAGCAAAHQLSLLEGWDIDLVERAPFLGGGVKTHWRGSHPFTFGPRHFLTPSQELFDYLNAIGVYFDVRSNGPAVALTALSGGGHCCDTAVVIYACEGSGVGRDH